MPARPSSSTPADGSVTNAKVASDAAIAASKLNLSAYYTAVQVDALLAAVAPRYVHIPCLLQPVENTGFTLTTVAPDRRTSSGNVNDTCAYDAYIPAGTWELALVHQTNSNRGRYTVSVDGETVGTVDGYSVSAVAYVESLISGLVFASGAVRRVRLTMADKNASSSSFVGGFQAISLRRIA